MIDNEEVNIGDAVFVLGIGTGTVKSISADGSFTVQTGRGIQTYRNGGYLGNSRRVYWHDPFILLPPKNLALWQALKRMVETDYNMIKELMRTDSPLGDKHDE